MSPEDLEKFQARFPELAAWLWDQQIAEDFAAGKLDGLIAEAREDFKAGRALEIVRQKIAVGLKEASCSTEKRPSKKYWRSSGFDSTCRIVIRAGGRPSSPRPSSPSLPPA